MQPRDPHTALPGTTTPQRRQGRFFYGWVIVAVSFLTLFLVVGTRFSLGVFYVAILEEYHWTRAETAGAFAVMLLVHAVFSLAIGVLFDRWGPRVLFPLGALMISLAFAACSQIRTIWQLYLFLGVAAAIGTSSLAFVPHMALVSAWFRRWRGTASGFAYAGIGSGQLALAPLIQGMIARVGWRGAFLSLAAVILVVVVPLTAIFQRRRPEDLGLCPDGEVVPAPPGPSQAACRTVTPPAGPQAPAWSFLQASRTLRFWLLMGTVAGMGIILNTLLLHLMAHLTDAGYSKLWGATLVGVVGGLRSLGGMSLGSLSDRAGREVAYTIGCAGCFLGIVLLASIHNTEQSWRLYGFALLYGIGHGALGPIYNASTADLFPGRSLGTILGVLEAAYGIGGAVGTYLAGYAYDLVGDYRISFVFVLVGIVMSCVCLWLAAPRHARRLHGLT